MFGCSGVKCLFFETRTCIFVQNSLLQGGSGCRCRDLRCGRMLAWRLKRVQNGVWQRARVAQVGKALVHLRECSYWLSHAVTRIAAKNAAVVVVVVRNPIWVIS